MKKDGSALEAEGVLVQRRQVSPVTVQWRNLSFLPHFFFAFFRFLFSLRVSCGALWVFRPCLFFPLLMRFPQLGFRSSDVVKWQKHLYLKLLFLPKVQLGNNLRYFRLIAGRCQSIFLSTSTARVAPLNSAQPRASPPQVRVISPFGFSTLITSAPSILSW